MEEVLVNNVKVESSQDELSCSPKPTSSNEEASISHEYDNDDVIILSTPVKPKPEVITIEDEESNFTPFLTANRSIDDKLKAFQRDLERKRDYSRDHSLRSRSPGREISRSSSRSRSYSSSKSWSRSHSRSSSRSSRSRSRNPLASRSRSRSYSHSRSRSWTKPRSYTRSRSRTRSPSSRSRSRSRTEPRCRRSECDSGERIRSPRPRSRSRSYTPKNYRHPSHSVSYTGRHSYTPPHFGASYQYGPASALTFHIGIPVLRTEYHPHHVHPIETAPQSLHSRPIKHYPVERQPKCPPPYNEMYPMYDVYSHQRYDREQRPPHYDKSQEYQKDYQRQHPEVIAHRIPGYIGDRPRGYKQRYRQPREPRKEIIRELREPSRSDRRRPESSSQSRSVRHYGRESMQVVEKSRRVENVPRSRSRSYESIESHNSFKRKHIKQHIEHSQEPPRHKSSREHSQSEPSESKSKRKHSPIKRPEKHTSESGRVKKQQRRHDLEFEPDYEPYSDIEEKERMKRSASPEVVRKKARVEKIITESSEKHSKKVEKFSATSRACSSAVNESKSSDSDEPKTTRNKVSDSDKQKHKKSKHKKHKHKEKKSHKSKRE